MFELDIGRLIWIFFAACLVNNFTLSYFLGLCPFLGVSGRIETAVRMVTGPWKFRLWFSGL